MALVDVVLNLGELLDGPLGDVDQGLYFVTSVFVQALDGRGETVTELGVVTGDKVEDVKDVV